MTQQQRLFGLIALVIVAIAAVILWPTPGGNLGASLVEQEQSQVIYSDDFASGTLARWSISTGLSSSPTDGGVLIQSSGEDSMISPAFFVPPRGITGVEVIFDSPNVEAVDMTLSAVLPDGSTLASIAKSAPEERVLRLSFSTETILRLEREGSMAVKLSFPSRSETTLNSVQVRLLSQ